MKLKDYIQKHHGGNQAAFARSMGVQPQLITQWIVAGYIVYEGRLYSPRKFEVKK